jgi:hypothetical protein
VESNNNKNQLEERINSFLDSIPAKCPEELVQRSSNRFNIGGKELTSLAMITEMKEWEMRKNKRKEIVV